MAAPRVSPLKPNVVQAGCDRRLGWLQGALLGVLAALWLKLAYDVVILFGADAPPFFFPRRAVIAIGGVSLLFALLNAVVLLRGDAFHASRELLKSRKALIVLALLGSMFSCWATETPQKAVDIYLVIPALILLLLVSPETRVGTATHLALLSLAIVLLIPNDTCANPQNGWWVEQIGASPMTYVAPVNLLLCLTSRAGGRTSVFAACAVLTGLYYAACVFHRFGGY